MKAELIMACQMFLVPSTILFAALGVAATEQLKTLISFMGLATSSTWFFRVLLWTDLARVDRRTALTLAGIFVAAWFVALIAHARLWYRESRDLRCT